MQCVVTCCSVLRCVAVCCIVDSSTHVFFSVNRIPEAFQQSCHILGVFRHRHRNRHRNTEADVDTDIDTETDTNTDIDVNIDTDIDTDENTYTRAEMHNAINFCVLPHENGSLREDDRQMTQSHIKGTRLFFEVEKVIILIITDQLVLERQVMERVDLMYIF